MKPTDPVLHIFSQTTWHTDVLISGTEEGLRNLVAAATQAIHSGMAVSKTVFQNDGEGFALQVSCIRNEDILADLPPAYIDPDAR